MDIIEPHIICTAGHIDHGKTELVKALTGIDTDRLKDEKIRGMSIELGYAYMQFPRNNNIHKIGIIDVPGHKRFLRTMVFGTGSVDFSLLVIDSLQGIQTQTEEHFNVLNLLGIKGGIAVLTKIEKTPQDVLKERIAETEIFIKDSPFSPRVLLVDSLSGKGIDELKKYIFLEVWRLKHKKPTHPLRIDVDRVFSIRGFGLIACGTCSSGSIDINNEVYILNSGKRSFVKNIQIHNSFYARGEAGQRLALNLKGITAEEIKKGYTLSRENQIPESRYLYAKMKMIKRQDPWKKPKSVRLLYKTREIISTLIFSGMNALFARIRPDSPVFATRNDRFIIRDISDSFTLGGGKIVYFSDKPLSVNNTDFLRFLRFMDKGDILPALKAILSFKPFYCYISDLIQLFSADSGTLASIIDASEDLIICQKKILVSRENLNRMLDFIRDNSDSKTFPSINMGNLKKGLYEKWDFTRGFVEIALKHLYNEGRIIMDRDAVSLSDDDKSSPEADLIPEILRILQNRKALADIKEILGIFQIPPDNAQRLITIIARDERIAVIDGSFLILRKSLEEIKSKLINYLLENKSIRVSVFKEIAQTSRKYALPLLKYFDEEKITYRIDDIRYLNSRILK